MSGREPGTPRTAPADYSGEAELRRSGEVYVFTGLIDGTRYTGLGLFDTRAGCWSCPSPARRPADSGVALLTATQGGFALT